MDEDINSAIFLAHGIYRFLDGVLGVFGIATVVPHLIGHIGHGVVADIARVQLLGLEFTAVAQFACFDIIGLVAA